MTRYLLDTQIVLWAAGDPGRLTPETLGVLTDGVSDVVVSSVSIAEMVIKEAIGKLALPVSAIELCTQLDLEIIPLGAPECQRMASIPLLHRDPFDRLLIAQCAELGLTMVTSDQQIWNYDDVDVLRNA